VTRRAGVFVLAGALLAAACSDGGDDDLSLDRSLGTTAPRRATTSTTAPTTTAGADASSSSSAPSSSTSPSGAPSPTGGAPGTGSPATTGATGAPTTTAPAAQPRLGEVAVRATPVLQVGSLTDMAVRPGHDATFLAERGGRVRAVVNGALRAEPVVSVTTTTGGERGLLGIAFSRDGGRLYLSYTDADGNSRLEEVAMGAGPAEVVAGSRRLLLTVEQPASNHNGGQVAIGPDGLLYLGLGDGGGGGDPYRNGQNTNTLLGSILRIDPRPDGPQPYSIPPDNPFVDGGGRPEVYVYGLRNPWRLSFDRATGDMWIGDVGQSAIEEIDMLPAGRMAGANLGWPLMEGTQRLQGDPPANHVPPVYEYANGQGTCGVIGGYVYRGSRIPALRGAYVFADLCESAVRAVVVEGSRAVEERAIGPDLGEYAVSSFGQDASGELYVLTLDGVLHRLDPE